MSKKYSFLLIFSFFILTGFFTWFLAIKEIKKDPVDINSEIQKAVLEESNNSASAHRSSLSGQAGTSSASSQAPVKQAVPPVPQPEPTPTPDSTKEEKIESDPLADWEKFESEKIKISLRYPPGFQVEEKERSLVLKKEAEKQLTLRVYENENGLDLENWFSGEFKEKDNAECQFLASDLKIGRLETKSVKAEALGGKCSNAGYYALTLDKRLIGAFLAQGKETDEQSKKILESLETL
jgi:hypothetical protein